MQEEICDKFAYGVAQPLIWPSVAGKLAANIRRLRKAKRLTQLQVAVGIGIQTATQVSLWESGKQKVSPDNVRKLSLFFVVPIDELDPENEAWDAESPRAERLLKQSHNPPSQPHVVAPPQLSMGVAMGPGEQALFDQIYGAWLLCRDEDERRALVKHVRQFVEHPDRHAKKAAR